MNILIYVFIMNICKKLQDKITRDALKKKMSISWSYCHAMGTTLIYQNHFNSKNCFFPFKVGFLSFFSSIYIAKSNDCDFMCGAENCSAVSIEYWCSDWVFFLCGLHFLIIPHSHSFDPILINISLKNESILYLYLIEIICTSLVNHNLLLIPYIYT